jgi:hypothetical protein
MSHRPVTLDDLDRDELLRLIRGGLLFRCSEADLIWAQWEVAGDRWQAAWAAYRQASMAAHDALKALVAANIAFGDALRGLASARKLASLSRATKAAGRRVIETSAAEARAKAKADRIRRRQDALLARHDALMGGSDAASA